MAMRRAQENHDRPTLLNEKMRVHFYDGGSFKNRALYQVKNVLIPTLENVHCSGQGQGPFNLVLKMVQGAAFTLSHLYLLGPGKKCTEPIKSCLVFVTQEPPNVNSSKFFDTLSPEELQEYVDGKELPSIPSGASTDAADGAEGTGDGAGEGLERPVAYFSTDKESREVEVELEKWVSGRYVLVKFMSTHNNQENMDVGVVGLVGYPSVRTDQRKFGPWLHRSVLSPWVHSSRLKSIFSSSGWVCDGRDSSGGCRCGQTDFHQTSVYTVTFRCIATGLDLCESCAYDETLGKVTSEFAQTDIQELKEPQTAKLVAGRIRNALRSNWRRNLSIYLEQDFLKQVLSLLETNCLPAANDQTSGRESGRLPRLTRNGFQFQHFQRPPLTQDAQRKVMRKALFQIINDICSVVFSLSSGSDFLISELIWAPDEGKYHEARIIKLGPRDGPLSYTVNWGHRLKQSTIPAEDVWKVQKEEMLPPTMELCTELLKGPLCDVGEVTRLLEAKADAAARDGLGRTLVYKAVGANVKKEVLQLLLDHGACVDSSTFPDGKTPLDIATGELAVFLVENGASVSSEEMSPVIEMRYQVAQSLLFPLVQLSEKVSKVPESERPSYQAQSLFVQSDRSPEVLEAVGHVTQSVPMDILEHLVTSDHETFSALKRMLDTFVLQDTAPNVLNCLKIANSLCPRETLRNMVLSIGARDWATTIMERATNLERHQNENKGLSPQISEEASKLVETLGDLEPPAVLPLTSLVSEIRNASSWAMKTRGFAHLIERMAGLPRIDNMETWCSSYEFGKADGPRMLLELVEAPQGPEFFTELFRRNSECAKTMVKTVLGVVELGERFSVWRYKKDKGLKALVDPITLKLKHTGNKVCSPATAATFTTSVEPLTSVQELSKYLLSVTPVADMEYIRYCHDLVDGEIILEDEEWDVVAFEITTDCIPLPIHTLARLKDGTREEIKVLLSIRDYSIKTAPPPAECTERDVRIALAFLKTSLETDEYHSLIKDFETVGAKLEDPDAIKAIQTLKTHENEAKKVMDEELARFAQTVEDKSADNGAVDPNLRVHTVMMTVGEELPFDLIWQMTREDIMGAVREICPRGAPQTEETIQMGIAANGMGPIAKNLTMREAENLSSRLGHCIQTAVVIDQQALEKERARERVSTSHLALMLGCRIKFSKSRGSEESLVGVLIGIHEKEQRYTLLDAATGILHEALPRSRLKSGSERRDDRWDGADILSQTDLIRLRDHLRRRVEIERAPPGEEGENAGPPGNWRAAIGELLEAGGQGTGAFASGRPGSFVLRLPAGELGDALGGQDEQGTGQGPGNGEPNDLEESESESERSAVEMIHQILEEEGEMDDGEIVRLNDDEGSRMGLGRSNDETPQSDEEMRDARASDDQTDDTGGDANPREVPMMEQIRMFEEVFTHDLGLNVGMNGFRIRLGLPGDQQQQQQHSRDSGAGGGVQTYQVRRSSGGPAARRPIPKAPLRTHFPAFLRASDSSNPTATLDHPVNKRLSPQDLNSAEPLLDDDEDCPLVQPTSAQLGRACVFPRFGLFDDKPTTDICKERTLIRLMQHLECGGTNDKVALENWGLSYELHVSIPPRPWNFQAPAKKRRRIATNSTSAPSTAEDDFSKIDCLAQVTTGISLLGHLHQLALPYSPGSAPSVDMATFVCQRLDRKLRCQLDDPLAIASGTLPSWAKLLPSQFPFLFSLKTRKLLMKYCKFGLSYSVHWMQEQRLGSYLRRRVALQTDLNTASEPRKIQELSQELSNVEEHVVRSSYWLGGLQTTLIKLEKGDQFLHQAINGLEALSATDSVTHTVEVQFENETGFGTGVTQSFYTDVANALLSKKENQKYPMWVEDDTVGDDHIGQRARRGLLIRPLWNASKELLRRFRFLGSLVGKALREGFIVPLPLSEEFFALAKGDCELNVDHLPRPGDGYSGEFVGACADFLEELRRNEIEAKTLNFPERFLLAEKNAAAKSAQGCITFDDYCSLSCASFLETGFDGANLDGEIMTNSRLLTIDTLEDFVEKAAKFWFRDGVKKQIEAFRRGLGTMLDLDSLQSFTSAEMKEMICGSETIEWDRQTLEQHVHPTNGLSRDSPIYKYLIDVLISMNNSDRARFLDFVSSCPRLLPGGKFYMDVCPAPKQQKYPRSRACANQLYLPEYSSREELQTNLFEAMYSSVGHHEQRLTRDL